MKQVLITGGAGYIGSILCKKLIDKGLKVRCFDVMFFGIDAIRDLIGNPNFELIKGDLRNIGDFPNLLDDVDAVVHLAALSNDPSADLDANYTMDINLHSSVKLAEMCKERKIKRFIFSSSCSVYGAAEDRILDEGSFKNPVSLYAKLKMEYENILLEMMDDDFCPCSLRHGTVYGISPKMRFDLVVNIMTKYAVNKGKVFIVGGGENWRPLVHVDDVAEAFVKTLEAPIEAVKGEFFNVGSNAQNYRVKEIAKIVAENVPGTKIEYAPSDKDSRSYRVTFDKIERLIGFKAKKTVPEGVKEIAEALRTGTLKDPDSIDYVNIKKMQHLLSIPYSEGGLQVRARFLPFAQPLIEDEEIDEVIDTLKSGWLTTGPKTKRFEEKLKEYTGAKHVVAVNSCTAALSLALIGAGIKEGDEVITTPITFAATSNVILHRGAKPVFVDIDKKTLNIDPDKIEAKITPKTKAIIAVDLAGQPCDYDKIDMIAKKHGLKVIEDAAHSIGAEYHGKKVGSFNKATCFSFYPIKNITAAEGGALLTDDDELAQTARIFSLHGMSKDAWKRYSAKGTQHWDIVAPGYKFNMTDVQAALGLVQIKKLDKFIAIRRKYDSMYRSAFAEIPEIEVPSMISNIRHAHHLFIILLNLDKLKITRDEFMEKLKDENIGTGIHFRSIPNSAYYSEKFGYKPEDFPNASDVSDRMVSLPMYPKMDEQDILDVIRVVEKVVKFYRK